jgi:hypothetical protein
MKLRLSSASLFLFGLSIVLWILLTSFESALVGMSLMMERGITILTLVLPAALGAVLAIISLLRRDGHARWAVAGILLNGFLALFHLMVLAFAG